MRCACGLFSGCVVKCGGVGSRVGCACGVQKGDLARDPKGRDPFWGVRSRVGKAAVGLSQLCIQRIGHRYSYRCWKYVYVRNIGSEM